ncbi:POK19 protein, partial [Nothocercus julius]|nr:POK19 protein [Nothocercus julius]
MRYSWVELPKISAVPLTEGITVFTDAGKASKKAAITWKEGGTWQHQIIPATEGDTLQTLELAAVAWAMSRWSEVPLNVVSDSLYVVGVVMRIEDALVKQVWNDRLYQLFL